LAAIPPPRLLELDQYRGYLRASPSDEVDVAPGENPMTRAKWIALCLALCAPTFLVPVTVRGQSPSSGDVTIGKRDSIWSATLKERRKYLVYTPPSYRDTTYLPRAYPVLYLLDGDAHFHSVTGLLQILGTGVNGTFVVPEMIVVAIPNTDRMRDLSPTRVDHGPDGKPMPGLATSGGMPNFLNFIKTELIPHVDSTWRTAPYRVFIGHSLGGITTIDALYTMPETFNAYVAIDPSLWWDDQVLLKKAKAVFSKPGLATRALYVGQANTINADDSTSNLHFNSIVQFNSILESYNKSGLRYAYKYYNSDDHGSVPMIAEYDALRFIFDGYKAPLLMSVDRPEFITEHFARVSEKMGYKVMPPEGMVDMLARIALSRDTTKALTLLQLNSELYPKSPHAFVALGDLRKAKGDASGARSAYERALAINPEHKHAREMLGVVKAGK
jgi:predicted alpha/beta superfamily hydrolase